MIRALALIALVGLGTTSADWSWTKPEDKPARQPVEAPAAFSVVQATAVEAPRSYSLEAQNIPSVALPLEGDTAVVNLEDLDPEIIRQLTDEEGRQGRFLGISKKLCKIGVKGMCDNPRGYPPVVPSHYGQPVSSYATYGSYPPNYLTKGGVKPSPPGILETLFKGHKKGIHKEPSGTYGAPAYAYQAPPASYSPPLPVKPTYSAPAHVYPPKPTYVDPIPTYNAPKAVYKSPPHVFSSPSIADVVAHHPIDKKFIETYTVGPIHPSNPEIRHVHTHTHVYKVEGASPYSSPFAKQGPADSVYQASGHVQHSLGHGVDRKAVPEVNNFGTKINTRPSLPSGSIEHSFSSSSSLSSLPVNSFRPSQQAASFSQINSNALNPTFQEKRHISQSNNFLSGQSQESNVNAAVRHITSVAQNSLSQSVYVQDCHCVPQQFCSPGDLVARSNPSDVSHLLDARNEKNLVLANATADEYYDYDYEGSSDKNETTTESLETEDATETNLVEEEQEPKEETRQKRNVAEETATTNSSVTLEGRQLTGFTPGQNGCGPGYVCCRRPVFTRSLPKPTCGKGNPSIHGRVASIEHETGITDFGEYPWQAAILRQEGEDSMFVCGATLINQQFLLTAAHCVNDLKAELLKVRLGEWDVNRDTEFYKHIEIPVSQTFIHSEFYPGNLYNDLAVVKMRNFVDFNYNPHIAPICLPPPHADFTNYKCQVTGWGKDAFGDAGRFQHILRELEIPVVDRFLCENALRSTRLGRSYKLHDGFICAGGEEGKDACRGDGGGPLVCSAGDGSFQLAGIVSWGIGCGVKNLPGVYVNIPRYVEWIRTVTGF